MRITNSMITNGMLLNMTRNVKGVNNLYNQLATGKKIQFPSDNPILASRALKFRTSVVETEQYQKNVAQGISWMEVTESAYNNINNIMYSIGVLVNKGATSTYTYEDRQKIATDIASLVDQIGLEMNVSYAGRYVFSGYRTDQPPILTENNNNTYEITQNFSPDNVETITSYQQNLGASITHEGVKIIKLPYSGGNINITSPDVTEEVSLNPTNVGFYSADAYNPPANGYHFIQETGELVIGSNAAFPTEITYTKTGFAKGELNPQVYFKCTDSTDPDNLILYNQNVNEKQYLELEFSTNTRIAINSLAQDVYTANMYADLNSFVKELQYATQLSRNELKNKFADAPHNLTGTALEDAVSEEVQRIQTSLYERFNNMLGLKDLHNAQMAKEQTNLGSRMSRLELIGNRLAEDRVSYTKLLSENEDVDYMEAIMLLQNAESVYQASLMAGGRIMQMTLANYI